MTHRPKVKQKSIGADGCASRGTPPPRRRERTSVDSGPGLIDGELVLILGIHGTGGDFGPVTSRPGRFALHHHLEPRRGVDVLRRRNGWRRSTMASEFVSRTRKIGIAGLDGVGRRRAPRPRARRPATARRAGGGGGGRAGEAAGPARGSNGGDRARGPRGVRRRAAAQTRGDRVAPAHRGERSSSSVANLGARRASFPARLRRARRCWRLAASSPSAAFSLLLLEALHALALRL